MTRHDAAVLFVTYRKPARTTLCHTTPLSSHYVRSLFVDVLFVPLFNSFFGPPPLFTPLRSSIELHTWGYPVRPLICNLLLCFLQLYGNNYGRAYKTSSCVVHQEVPKRATCANPWG